jgi:hypothetical protein
VVSWHKQPFPSLDIDYACSLDDVAEELEITRQAAQQLEISALRKLREGGVLDEWLGWLRAKNGHTLNKGGK